MEHLRKKVEAFLKPGHGHGSGYGYGSGYGSSSGDGYGDGYGDGSGYGDGHGDGHGHGSGSGDGYGYGYGHDYGYGYGVQSLNGISVYLIDDVLTAITQLHGDVARGYIVQGDLTKRDCYVVKRNGLFAHGDDLKSAQAAVMDKVFAQLDADERIAEFAKTHAPDAAYLTADFYKWHGLLTGSCAAGRDQFARDRGIDMGGAMTVDEFIALCENAYGREIIAKVKGRYA